MLNTDTASNQHRTNNILHPSTNINILPNIFDPLNEEAVDTEDRQFR